MTNEQHQVKDWMQAYGQETPEKPTIPSLEIRRLRAKLILEEALETVEALGFHPRFEDLDEPNHIFAYIHGHDLFEIIPVPGKGLKLEEILDGCEDLKVVTEGTLVACGLVKDTSYEESPGITVHPNNDPHFNEVMRSNWSKMWTKSEVEEYISCRHDEDTYSFYQVTEDKYLAKNKDGKVIKSPSYSPPNFNI